MAPETIRRLKCVDISSFLAKRPLAEQRRFRRKKSAVRPRPGCRGVVRSTSISSFGTVSIGRHCSHLALLIPKLLELIQFYALQLPGSMANWPSKACVPPLAVDQSRDHVRAWTKDILATSFRQSFPDETLSPGEDGRAASADYGSCWLLGLTGIWSVKQVSR